jgi:hypothetical protein
MKKIIIIFVTVFSSLILNAQNRYEKEMQSALKSLEESEQLQDYKKIANKFEQIARIEKEKWLPQYYVGYSYIVMSRLDDEETESRDLALDKAQEYLDKAKELSLNNEEITVLQAYIYQSRFFIDPNSRLGSFGKTSRTILDAVELYPNNPRANLIHGIQIFHKPAFLGGGAKKAKPYFDIAKKLFDDDNKIESALYPNWGKDANDHYREKCN